jgi:hypothetical protein
MLLAMQFRLLIWITFIALCGCSVEDSRTAQRAESGLVGLSQPDLETCLGVPNRIQTFQPRTTILSYDGTSTSSGGLSVTLPVVGGLSFSGGGYCHLVARLDDGKVTAIHYTGETNATFGSEAYCAPLVRSCLEHLPPKTPVASQTPPQSQAIVKP